MSAGIIADPSRRPIEISRRLCLGGLFACVTGRAFARFPHTVPDGLVFFVGNSFTRQHAIPALVCRIAEHSGVAARCHPNTANGATLSDSVGFARTFSAERGSPLPATVILQDHSIEPLTVEGRQRSARSMALYSAQFEKTVLFETWPRRSGHPLYKEPGMPGDPREMAEIVHDHYSLQAKHLGAAHAPVGLGFMAAVHAGIDVYARDGYHANIAGAWLAAMMLARALEMPDAFATPAPNGVDVALGKRLAMVADAATS